LRLRVAPHLHFAPDEELERGNRLEDLITRAVREDREKGTLPDAEAHYDSDDDSNDDDAVADDRP
jgi:hypothetical protein